MSEMVLNQRVIWDTKKLREIDEAKALILGYKRQGFEIVTVNGTPMERFHPSLGEVIIKAKKVALSVMKILCDKGDERLTWDKDNGKEAKEAKKKFQELIAKGYKAYSVDEGAKRKRPIEEFDVDAEEILMIPPTAKG